MARPPRWAAALAVLFAVLVAPVGASARVALVATGTPELAFVDVTTDVVAVRMALPGRARAVTVTRDGARAYVAAGAWIVAVDVNARTEVGRVALPGPEIGAVVVSPGGGRLYAVQGRRLVTLDTTTLRVVRGTRLLGAGLDLAVGPGGNLGAVPLASGRVAFVRLEDGRLLRRVRLPGAAGAAIDRAGRTWISAGPVRRQRGARGRRTARPRDPRTLAIVRFGARRAQRVRMRLPSGAGGRLALGPGGTRLVVGAYRSGRGGALVDLRSGRVRRLGTGRGPGSPAWTPDGSRIFVADLADATLSLVSPASRVRLLSIALPGSAPAGVVVQPGLALIAGTEGPDMLSGTRSRDLMEGLGGDDVLRGGRDNDVLRGGFGDDHLDGGTYDDRAFGGDGDDLVTLGSGNDRVDGGPGIDTVDGGTGNDTVNGDDGDDRLDGGDGDDRIFGGPGNDSIVERGFGNDRRLYGGPGDDYIRGGRGSDRLVKGGDGDDELYGESGTENITGGEGNDTVDGGRARDLLAGNNGDDHVRGDSGDDDVTGGFGTDRVDGGSGEDRVEGGDGPDEAIGGPGPDVIEAGPGDDLVRAADDSRDLVDCGGGVDTVLVEADFPQRDVLVDCETVQSIPPEAATDAEPVSIVRGTAGNDLLRGTPESDSMFGKAGADRMFGGAGDDYVDGEWGPDELHGGPGDDVLAGRSAGDRIYGDSGDDRITGDRGGDLVDGGRGNDELFGNLGSDRVRGGSGDDRINVVRGEYDIVVCGSGKDVVFADITDRVARDCEQIRR